MHATRVVRLVAELSSFVDWMRLSDNVGYDCPYLDGGWPLTDMVQ